MIALVKEFSEIELVKKYMPATLNMRPSEK